MSARGHTNALRKPTGTSSLPIFYDAAVSSGDPFDQRRGLACLPAWSQESGVKTIIVPKDNEKDLADIPKNVLDVLNIHMVSHMDEVLKIALVGPLTPIPPTPDADFDESSDATTH